jgi:glucose/arabinose dehydrogenase/mono/diheme cytochrome c family protein
MPVRRLTATPLVALPLLLAMAAPRGCDRAALPPTSPDNGGLALPDGFGAVVVHDGVGRARHLAVTDDGRIYIKLRVPAPKGLVGLRDTSGDGRADDMQVFGEYADTGDYGTAMRIHAGHLYFTTAREVYRQRLEPGRLVPTTPVETVLRHDYRAPGRSYEHIAKPIAFDGKGHMFVPFGAPGDTCQEENRRPESPGRQPCDELEATGGVWQFSDSRLDQTQRDGRRYATGIRSLVAMTWNPHVGELYALQHGRDDLYRTWSRFFTRWQSAVLPSEEFFKVTDGFDGGWPFYYYDQLQGTKKLNPEYGGDGQKLGDGPQLAQPIMGFPGHFAPNDLLFYRGDQFPERYRRGAFIAFHGSTIRMPYSQAGYTVAFVPFAGDKPSGPWEVFADGFAGVDPIPNTSDAAARPVGLAEGPDGSLYVSDSVKGKIWRIVFTGNRAAFGPAALARMEARKTQQAHLRTPHERDDVLGREVLDAGAQVYETYCVACHQRDGRGDGARFPPVTSTRWVSGDPARLIGVVLNGLQGEIQVEGKTFNGVMPANAFLTDQQVAQVVTYLRQNFGNFAGGVTPEEVAAVRAKPPAVP